MKKLLLGTVLSTTLLLAACGGEKETDTSSEETTAEEETEMNDKGTRSNPYQIGDTATVVISDFIDGEDIEGKANVTIDNVLRGEDAMAEIDYEGRPNQHGQYEGSEDLERMVFNMEFELVEFKDDDTAYEPRGRVEVYTMDGEQLDDDSIPNIQNDFGDKELYQGGVQSGQLNQIAPVEGPFLIKLVAEDVFFEVK